MENISSSPKSSKVVSLIKKNKKLIKVLVVLVAVLLAFGLTYRAGQNSGKKQVAATAKQKTSSVTTPQLSLPTIISGEVSKVGAKDVTIKQADGKETKLTFDAKLRVTKKGQTVEASTMAKDAKVVAYTKPGSPSVVTRIVLR